VCVCVTWREIGRFCARVCDKEIREFVGDRKGEIRKIGHERERFGYRAIKMGRVFVCVTKIEIRYCV
jgi:hypothetical protein